MNSLVAYASSDEDDDEVESPRPAKIPKLDTPDPVLTTAFIDAPPVKPNQDTISQLEQPPSISQTQEQFQETQPETTSHPPILSPQPQRPIGPLRGPAPSIDPAPSSTTPPPLSPTDQPSPYTSHRAQIHTLTLPPNPTFDIPPTPSPPPPDTPAARAYEARTQKATRFLALKKQGTHFHTRLASSAALRNPALLSALIGFVGMSEEEMWENCLPEGTAARTDWKAVGDGRANGVEWLLRENEREGKRRRAEKGVEFVAGKGG